MVVSNKNMILCSPNDQPIAQLNGLRIDSVSYTEPLKDYKTLEFVVDKYIDIDGEYQLSNGYDNISVYMEIYIDGLGYFQLQEPSINNDGYKESKTCVAYSIEKELESKDLVGFLINQGTKDSMEYLATNNVDDLGFAKEYVTFYNTSNKELSLMDLVLEQLPGWSIGHIDTQLKTKKLAFNEDSINIYAFLCSEVAPKAECIFVFDNTDRIINAYGKDNIGEDTNVFISFRNLLKSVDILCDEDSVVTRFAVSGADNLDIRNVNFNDRRIFNLDYFMREPYMSDDLVQKLQTWISYRDGKRSDYVDLTRQYLDLESKMYEIQYRLPLDGCDWEQWDSMDKESLEKNLKYYNALLTDLQVSVDPDPQYTTDADGNKTYIPWKDSSGNVDHQRYLDLLYKQTNGYGGYYTYYEVKEYIIPNIETAISNLDLPEDQKAEYNKDYETNWDLYGTIELTAKKDFYEKQVLEVLADYEKPWSELTEEEQASHSAGEAAYNIQHNKYVEYKEYLGDEQTEGSLLHTLKKLNDELDSLKIQQENIGTKRTDMISDVSISNSRFAFSSIDIAIINRLFHDTDYTNENILTTSIDTTLTTLDVQEDLYQDAVSKLSECSQPQYNFTIEVENLLSIEEFKDWNSEFVNGNYFMLGVSDDYAVKLRLVSRSWNPCDITPDLTVEFSNMILSKDGRSDISYLFDEINRAAKNAINIGSGNAKDSLELSTEILQKLINSQAFHNAVTDITADNAEITNIVAEYIEASEIKVDKITGTEAEFDTLFSKYIDADYINARVVISDTGEFKQLSADVAEIQKLLAGEVSADSGLFINLTAQNAKISEQLVAEQIATKISVGQLKAGIIDTTKFIISSGVAYDDDGNPSLLNKGILIQDGTQTFTDANGNIRVQIGEDASGGYSMYVFDDNGNLIFDATNGLYADGIKSPIIKDSMVAPKDGTYAGISASKLDISSIVESINLGESKIDGSSVVVDGESLNAKFYSITKSLNDVTVKEGNYILQLYCDPNVEDGSVIFSAKVWFQTEEMEASGEEPTDITDSFNDINFSWTRISENGDADYTWNEQHVTGKSITVSKDEKDYSYKCIFSTTSNVYYMVDQSGNVLVTDNGTPILLFQ